MLCGSLDDCIMPVALLPILPMSGEWRITVMLDRAFSQLCYRRIGCLFDGQPPIIVILQKVAPTTALLPKGHKGRSMRAAKRGHARG